jgi:hypothetical protein
LGGTFYFQHVFGKVFLVNNYIFNNIVKTEGDALLELNEEAGAGIAWNCFYYSYIYSYKNVFMSNMAQRGFISKFSI